MYTKRATYVLCFKKKVELANTISNFFFTRKKKLLPVTNTTCFTSWQKPEGCAKTWFVSNSMLDNYILVKTAIKEQQCNANPPTC